MQPDLFLVAAEGGILGTAMAGHHGHLYYLAVAPERQGRGLGRAMVRAVERLLLDLGCPKLTLQVRAGDEQVETFYARLGYEPDGASGYGRRLIRDDCARPTRSALRGRARSPAMGRKRPDSIARAIDAAVRGRGR